MSRRGVTLAWPALAAAAREASSCTAGARACLGALNASSQSYPTSSTSSPAPLPPSTCPPLLRPPTPLLPNPSTASPLARLPSTPARLHGRCFSADAGPPSGPPSGPPGGPGAGEARMSLGEALNRLVDAAVEKVEAGDMGEAISLLKEGLATFEPMFPNSPELGELHNQVSLLLLFQGSAEEAAGHAQTSLDTTRHHFGSSSVLTAHRLLRLGVAKFAGGKMAEAAGLLREAYGLLGGDEGGAAAPPAGASAADAGSRAEAGFFLDLTALAHVREASGVEALGPSIRGHLRGIKEAYGADSMILSLALSQHSRLVHGGLESADFLVGEALLKQHLGLLTEALGADAEDVAVTRYKLATYYYANDLLPDAAGAVRQAATSLRARHSDDHDLLVLCRHRLGMVCAAQGDHRSAKQLLGASRQHFLEGAGAGAEGGGGAAGGQSMLAKEADIGLAMAKFRAVDPVRESRERRTELQAAALEEMRGHIEQLSQAIGGSHMLVHGATRYYGQLSKLVR
ncbi:hypothetical protein HYH03_000656 [Edaphochlamys debaryana]|uniref:Uncharacterized protein n=1 Tax=Edaphochlamys debaryana TaxID=47281 RepID=A0A835YI04_9CHLO|nr:hypothetical protein HYH03_000656 [Edaphochlamys debaryana]|eukprot:KAG2502169.1 hypothetical protein HYH03_000656 [Edaphochlamys debaryana]